MCWILDAAEVRILKNGPSSKAELNTLLRMTLVKSASKERTDIKKSGEKCMSRTDCSVLLKILQENSFIRAYSTHTMILFLHNFVFTICSRRKKD